MRYVSVIFSVIWALDLCAAEAAGAADTSVKSSSEKAKIAATSLADSITAVSTTSATEKSPSQESAGKANAKSPSQESTGKISAKSPSQESENKTAVGAPKAISENKAATAISNETAANFAPSSRDLWRNSAANFDAIFKSERQSKLPDMSSAWKIIRKQIINRDPDQHIDQYAVYAELRGVFPESEFSTEELLALVEDAMEIKKKYLLILDFVIRSEHARRTVREGINADEVLQFASSEYIQLPKFVLKDNVDGDQLDEVLSDLGCGVVWKDRAKYLFVLNKYFGKGGAKSGGQAGAVQSGGAIKSEKSGSMQSGSAIKSEKSAGAAEAAEVAKVGSEKPAGTSKATESTRFPRRVQNYLKLIEEVDKFFGGSYGHLVYLIAQDFYYADVPPEKIKKIFSFSEEEWTSLVKPKVYR